MKRYIILFLFLLNLITGILLLNNGLFHHDSVVLAKAVEDTYKMGQLQPAIRGRFGSVIINLILYFPFFLLGHDADFAIRLSSILFHSASIVVLFLFIRHLLKNEIQAFIVSLLFSFTPIYFTPNTYGKEHGASIFFLLLSFYLLSQGINKKSWILLSISGFLAAFSVTIRESLLPVMPLYFLLYLNPEISIRPFRVNFPKDRFSLKLMFFVIFPFALAFSIAFFAYLKSEICEAIFVNNTASAQFKGILSPIFTSALRDLVLGIPMVLTAFFIIGLGKAISEKRNSYFLFFFLWLLLIFYFGNLSIYCPRYLDIIMIPFYVFVSYALYDLYIKNRMIAVSIIAYCVLSMFIFMFPMLVFRHNYNGGKEFALYVRDKTEEGAIIIAVDDSPFIEYYGKRRTMPYPIGDKDKADFFIKSIEKNIKNNVPVYLIQSSLIYDPDRVFMKEISRKFDIKKVGEKLTEDYHRPELEFQTYNEKLFKITLKNHP